MRLFSAFNIVLTTQQKSAVSQMISKKYVWISSQCCKDWWGSLIQTKNNLKRFVGGACHHKRNVHRNVECIEDKIQDMSNVIDFRSSAFASEMTKQSAESTLESHVSMSEGLRPTILMWVLVYDWICFLVEKKSASLVSACSKKCSVGHSTY